MRSNNSAVQELEIDSNGLEALIPNNSGSEITATQPSLVQLTEVPKPATRSTKAEKTKKVTIEFGERKLNRILAFCGNDDEPESETIGRFFQQAANKEYELLVRKMQKAAQS